MHRCRPAFRVLVPGCVLGRIDLGCGRDGRVWDRVSWCVLAGLGRRRCSAWRRPWRGSELSPADAHRVLPGEAGGGARDGGEGERRPYGAWRLGRSSEPWPLGNLAASGEARGSSRWRSAGQRWTDHPRCPRLGTGCALGTWVPCTAPRALAAAGAAWLLLLKAWQRRLPSAVPFSPLEPRGRELDTLHMIKRAMHSRTAAAAAKRSISLELRCIHHRTDYSRRRPPRSPRRPARARRRLQSPRLLRFSRPSRPCDSSDSCLPR